MSEATNGSPKARLIVWLGKTTFLRIAITFNAFPSFFVFVWQKKPFHLKRWAYYSCGCPWGCTFKSRISFQGYFYIFYYTHIFFQFFNGFNFFFFWTSFHLKSFDNNKQYIKAIRNLVWYPINFLFILQNVFLQNNTSVAQFFEICTAGHRSEFNCMTLQFSLSALKYILRINIKSTGGSQWKEI